MSFSTHFFPSFYKTFPSIARAISSLSQPEFKSYLNSKTCVTLGLRCDSEASGANRETPQELNRQIYQILPNEIGLQQRAPILLAQDRRLEELPARSQNNLPAISQEPGKNLNRGASPAKLQQGPQRFQL
jgi:hypothetical protein